MNRRTIKHGGNIEHERDRPLSGGEGASFVPAPQGRPGRYAVSIDRQVVESYRRLGSSLKVADELGVGATYVRTVLKAAGVLRPRGGNGAR